MAIAESIGASVATLGPSGVARPATELGLDRYADCVYSEVRLASGLDQVDYLASFPRARAALVSEALTSPARPPGFDTEPWRALQRVTAEWARTGTSLTRVPLIWFEFDDIAGGAANDCPSLSLCLVPGYDVRQGLAPSSPEALQTCEVALELLSADRPQRQSLSEAFAQLPDEGRWIHLSYMLGRTPRAVKLYGVLKREQLLSFLERIGWAGDRAAIAEALRLLYPSELLGDVLYLDLNLANFRDPRRCTLGLAVAQQHLASGVDDDPLRKRVLDIWTLAGLCDERKVELSRRWPKTAAGVLLGPFQKEVRFLDLKLVWHAGAGFHAKAYWGRQRLRGLFS